MDNRIAAVISSHGFGHAARTCAILSRLKTSRPDLVFEIFSQVPEWFFRDSLGSGYSYNPFPSDVGLIQRSPFAEDLGETANRINEVFLSKNGFAADLARSLTQKGCRLVLCDISPLGIMAAKKVGIPSLLVENFTWDWIYAGYVDSEPRFLGINPLLNSIFSSADFHIQTEPVCAPCRCDLVSRPVAREPRNSRENTRERLNVPPEIKLLLITTGGIEQIYPGLEALTSESSEVHFVIPGSASQIEIRGNTTLLPHHSDFYHPDLVHACDVVVGKLGYSTVAEAFRAGVPIGYVPRDRFRETGPLASFVRNNLGGIEISYSDFESGEWVRTIPQLLELSRQTRSIPNGADEIAQFILRIPELLN